MSEWHGRLEGQAGEQQDWQGASEKWHGGLVGQASGGVRDWGRQREDWWCRGLVRLAGERLLERLLGGE